MVQLAHYRSTSDVNRLRALPWPFRGLPRSGSRTQVSEILPAPLQSSSYISRSRSIVRLGSAKDVQEDGIQPRTPLPGRPDTQYGLMETESRSLPGAAADVRSTEVATESAVLFGVWHEVPGIGLPSPKSRARKKKLPRGVVPMPCSNSRKPSSTSSAVSPVQVTLSSSTRTKM